MRPGPLAAAAAVAAVLLLPLAAPQSDPVDPPFCPRIVAHRAGGSFAPENTVAGIQASAAAGVSMVEMDVRWSVSGYPVLMHDDTLDRTTTGTGKVAETGLNAMTALPAQDYTPWKTNTAYAGVKVPYAYDFVNASYRADVDMLLDVKPVPKESDARKLIEYVDRFAYRNRLVYMSSPAGVTAMRGWFPDLAYTVIEYPPAGMIRTGESLRSLGATGYAVPYDRITPAAVGYWKSYGMQVFTWTSDSAAVDVAANWASVSAAGVDALITDRPTQVAAWRAPLCGAASTGPSAVASTTTPIPTAPTTAPTTDAPPTEPAAAD